MYAAQSSHLPFKINMSGVIPPIFALEHPALPGDRRELRRHRPGLLAHRMQDVLRGLGYGPAAAPVIYGAL